jgi:DNA invertase Pin-like site-specific DNA recombinase
LIADDVLAIRAMYQKGVIGYNAIAKRFRLATHTVYSIVNRRTWTHI